MIGLGAQWACISSRFKLLSLFFLEQQRKKPLLSHWTNQHSFLHRDNLCTALLSRGLETLSKRDFVVSVLGEMMFLQAGVVGRFEASESYDDNSPTEIVRKKKGCERCRVSRVNSVYKVLPVYALLLVFISWRDWKVSLEEILLTASFCSLWWCQLQK